MLSGEGRLDLFQLECLQGAKSKASSKKNQEGDKTMTEYLKAKWRRLRMMKMRGMAEINYRLIRIELKLSGERYAK